MSASPLSKAITLVHPSLISICDRRKLGISHHEKNFVCIQGDSCHSEVLVPDSYLLSHSPLDTSSIISHEILHFHLGHLAEIAKIAFHVDRVTFNIACDAIVNDMLGLLGIIVPGVIITGQLILQRSCAASTSLGVYTEIRTKYSASLLSEFALLIEEANPGLKL